MKVLSKVLKVQGIILLILVVIAGIIYFTMLRYPNLKNNPTIDKWYRIETSEMKSSEGGAYHALIKKGSQNKVMVYFAGGGVSINEDTAKYDTYNTKLVQPDALANLTMNMGGLASTGDSIPFNDWTIILFPYATGDFHAGAGEYKYTDLDGKEKTLYHNGYINFKSAMDEALRLAGIKDAESVLVTGYSAGGWGASILANDVFKNYFPSAQSKTVLVDSSVALYDDWYDVATNVWNVPKHISNRIKTNNLTLDNLIALYEDFGDEVNILFNCSTRDGDLAKVQRYFNDLIIDSDGEMPVDESDGDKFQVILKEFVTQLKEQTNANVFIYDGFAWYDNPINLTSHTIISTPYVWQKLNDTDKSIAEWLIDAIDGNKNDYGMELLDKTYESKVK